MSKQHAHSPSATLLKGERFMLTTEWIPVTLKSSGRGLLTLLVALFGLAIVDLTPQALASPAFKSFDRPAALSLTKRPSFSFDLVTSAGAAACLPDARGEVRLTTHGATQQMDVNVSGLPANDTFTVFVLQVPHGPFGMAWYQGDIETDSRGDGHGRFIGIFSDETFVVAPGSVAAPVEHPADASTNPQTAPVHLFHLGMWFDSPAEAAAAGCPAGQTPFNGDHTAGIQVLNTTDFPDGDGPIGQFIP
jgi:hypothetical protein